MRGGSVVGFAAGCVAALAAQAIAQIEVHVNTNGQLLGYIVQDEDGVEICRDPMVWLQFRGPENYIVCQ